MSDRRMAVAWEPDLFPHGAQGRIYGRHVANRNLVRALGRRMQDIGCYGISEEKTADLMAAASAAGAQAAFLSRARPEELSSFGTLLCFSPAIQSEVWRRARFSPNGWSIVGQCHSLAEGRILHALAGLVRAPIRPFDAIVCQSRAARDAVAAVADAEEDDLRRHLGAMRFNRPRLPVIPLPIDCSAYATDEKRRAGARKRLRLNPKDIALLHVGRLDRKTKAHPIPLFLAAQCAAKRLKRPLTLILAGWAPSQDDAAAIVRSASVFCPDVPVRLFLDASEAVVLDCYRAADIFVSLSDNIQEGFGLAVAQALAAGLPAIVSDWNGYRDIVRDNVDGLLVPTLSVPAHFGDRMADLYHAGLVAYEDYTEQIALRTSVSVEATAGAIVALASDEGRRRAMGTAGRSRALECFDLEAVADSYAELFDELAVEREKAPEQLKRTNAATMSPFRIFASHPQQAIASDRVIGLRDASLLTTIMAEPASAPALFERSSIRIVERLQTSGHQTVAALVDAFPRDDHGEIVTCLLWLAKFGIVEITPAATAP